MNKEDKNRQSILFKKFQKNLKHEKTFSLAIEELLEFRKEIENMYDYLINNLLADDYTKRPIKRLKTIAYYIYHLNRIEDITLNTLILNEPQIFYQKNYQLLINSKISTTGNELKENELIDFSKNLNIDKLILYAKEVFCKTNKYLKQITYTESKIKVKPLYRENLLRLKSVSSDENAIWLIDYWCKKDQQGLILMPFTRHQFMHLWNCMSILERLNR